MTWWDMWVFGFWGHQSRYSTLSDGDLVPADHPHPTLDAVLLVEDLAPSASQQSRVHGAGRGVRTKDARGPGLAARACSARNRLR